MPAAESITTENRRICPEGCTYQYASPQHLRSLQLQLEMDWPSSSSFASSFTSASQDSQPEDMPHAHSRRRKLMQTLRACWTPAAFCGHCCGASSSLSAGHSTGGVDVLIDGRAADMWSTGVVLFEMVRPSDHCCLDPRSSPSSLPYCDFPTFTSLTHPAPALLFVSQVICCIAKTALVAQLSIAYACPKTLKQDRVYLPDLWFHC